MVNNNNAKIAIYSNAATVGSVDPVIVVFFRLFTISNSYFTCFGSKRITELLHFMRQFRGESRHSIKAAILFSGQKPQEKARGLIDRNCSWFRAQQVVAFHEAVPRRIATFGQGSGRRHGCRSTGNCWWLRMQYCAGYGSEFAPAGNHSGKCGRFFIYPDQVGCQTDHVHPVAHPDAVPQCGHQMGFLCCK